MSIADVAPVLLPLNGIVCCPTCGLPAILEARFRLQGTDVPSGRLRISCADGHSWLLLADRVRHVALYEDHPSG